MRLSTTLISSESGAAGSAMRVSMMTITTEVFALDADTTTITTGSGEARRRTDDEVQSIISRVPLCRG